MDTRYNYCTISMSTDHPYVQTFTYSFHQQNTHLRRILVWYHQLCQTHHQLRWHRQRQVHSKSLDQRPLHLRLGSHIYSSLTNTKRQTAVATNTTSQRYFQRLQTAALVQ